MKHKYLSAAAALLCAAGLTACGGSGNGSLSLGVQVFGLDRAGLQVQNGSEVLDISANGNVFFKTLLAPDATFEVTVKTNPNGVKCTAANNTGRINVYTYLQTVVTCVPDAYTLGGTVSGLTANGLILANGASNVALVAGQGSFTFATPVANAAPYGVTVLAQPVGQVCTVSSGTGTMPQANVTSVVVTCQKA